MKKRWWLAGLGVALLLALAAPLASSAPDGLERVAERAGFLDRARAAVFELLPDYSFSVIGNSDAATVAAGIAGTLLLFLVGAGLARSLRKKDGAQHNS